MKFLQFSPDLGLEWAKTINFFAVFARLTDFSQTIRTVPLVCGDGRTRRTRLTGRTEWGGWRSGGVGWGDGKASLSGVGSEAYRELSEFVLKWGNYLLKLALRISPSSASARWNSSA